jgi:hypothetical protein
MPRASRVQFTDTGRQWLAAFARAVAQAEAEFRSRGRRRGGHRGAARAGGLCRLKLHDDKGQPGWFDGFTGLEFTRANKRIRNAETHSDKETGMRILIAEDDQVLADGLLRALRSSGAAVDHVATGTEADAALMTNKEFDLLILDLGLPKMHGLEVLASCVPAARRCRCSS